MNMNIRNIIEHVFVDTTLCIEIGVEENNTYHTEEVYNGTAANVPREWYDKEIFLIIPKENGVMKIITR